MKPIIVSSIGVYPRPNHMKGWKYNGVDSQHLANHIDYNLRMRTGRALFLQGRCIYPGSLTSEQIWEVEAYMEANPHTPVKDTQPYH